ncbi:MAG: hypothetical protein RLZZ440_753 [Planctomycetota bacterium]|jgi:hypothetical protein
MSRMSLVRSAGPLLVAGLAFVAGLLVGQGWPETSRLPIAQAMSSLADQTFAVCTAPIDRNVEGLFILDFETGDLTGGVLAQTGKFAATYRHNVLEDLGIEVGAVKNQRFMIVPGMASVGSPGTRMGTSVLYVTDAATGATVAYGIPTGGKPGAAGAAALVPLDIARPRGGGPVP